MHFLGFHESIGKSYRFLVVEKQMWVTLHTAELIFFSFKEEYLKNK